jgi:hypothetical protein
MVYRKRTCPDEVICSTSWIELLSPCLSGWFWTQLLFVTKWKCKSIIVNIQSSNRLTYLMESICYVTIDKSTFTNHHNQIRSEWWRARHLDVTCAHIFCISCNGHLRGLRANMGFSRTAGVPGTCNADGDLSFYLFHSIISSSPDWLGLGSIWQPSPIQGEHYPIAETSCRWDNIATTGPTWNVKWMLGSYRIIGIF